MTYTRETKTSASIIRNTSKLIAIALVATSAMAGTANAQQTSDQTAVFTGIVANSCTVGVATPGALGVRADQSRLGSDETGGVAAIAAVVTNSDESSIQVLAPVAFDTAPVGANVNTEFSTSFALTGTTNAEAPDGSVLTDLNLGASTITVDAAAEKTDGTFGGGLYTFTTTIRCISP